MFLVYINDIVNGIESIIKLFADDTSLSLGLQSSAIRAEIINSDLEKIDDWAKTWKVEFNQTKTELLNTLRGNAPVYNLTFSNTVLQQNQHHKHLGVILQNNCKWGEHIDYVVSKASGLIHCLRSFKYNFSRKALETLYKSFILPIFDYADVLWDGCTDEESDKLEKLHIDALRTITGAVRGTSHSKLYQETGFCSLRERRRRHKLTMYRRLIHGNCPDYLSDLTPPLISSVNPYHRRRPNERRVPPYRTEIYRKSFIPSTTILWNELPENIQRTDSISQFKRYLALTDSTVPPYYYLGDRKPQIIHCRLRLNMSDLNFDLFTRHLTDNPSCACGHRQETAEHYLLYCSNHLFSRTQTILTLPTHLLETNTLLKGQQNLSIEENENVFKTVLDFISLSKRLTE